MLRRLVLAACLGAANAHAQPTDSTKLALARQYAELSHRGDFIARTYKHQLELSWTALKLCDDVDCQTQLDQAIDGAVTKATADYQEAIVKLWAERLTEDQLRAAIAFVQSPAGQAIIAAQDDMSDDAARLAHQLAVTSNRAVADTICTKNADACARIPAARLGMH